MRALLAAIAFCALPALAEERMTVCAKAQGGSGYKVQATVISGSDLKMKTSSMRFSSVSTYVVIFWQQDQASIIELDFPYVSPLGTRGVDQQGRVWDVSSSSLCF